jgi:hypothetical protein
MEFITFILKPIHMRFPHLAQQIARNVKAIMIDCNCATIDEFAVLCHMDRATMYDILKGNHNMQDFNLYKISFYTKTPMDKLTEGCCELVDEKYDKKKTK